MASTLIDRLDGLSSSAAIKGPVKAATTVNITLSGEQTIDGVAIVDGDRVLVKDQTTASENGIYVADTGPWRRAKDFNRTRDVVTGTLVVVFGGDTNAGTWQLTTSDPIVVGTSSIAFTNFIEASAGLPFPAVANSFLQRNAGNTAYDAKTPTQVFDITAPTTARGDLIFRNATTNARLAASTAGYLLQTNGAGDDPAWVGFLQSGTGAVTRTWQDKIREHVSVKDFGAVGDGATDDLAAIQAAVDTGKDVYFPFTGSFYNISSALVVNTQGQRLFSDRNTYLRTTSATAEIITINSGGTLVEVSSLHFAASVARTGGAYISTNDAHHVRLRNLVMDAPFIGIAVTGSSGTGAFGPLVEDVKILNVVSAGHGATVQTATNNVDVVFRDILITGGNSGSQPNSGIFVRNAGDITVDRVSTFQCGNGLNLQPTNGFRIQSMWVLNSWFDTGSGNGVNLSVSGATGRINSLRLTNVWCATNNNGFALVTSSSGAIQDVIASNCLFSGNTSNGVIVTDSGTTNLRLVASSMSQNTTAGVNIAANCAAFFINHCTIGTCGEFTGNGSGIILGNGVDHFDISDNRVIGNTSGAIGVGTLPGTPGETFWIARNDGIVTRKKGQVTLTSAATTTSISHGLASTPRFQDIVITPNSGWGTAGNWWVASPGATTFSINTSSNPGAGVTFSWDARLWGD